MTYVVHGITHGEEYLETGFATREDAQIYASAIIDGDVDSTIVVEREDRFYDRLNAEES